MKAIVFPKVGEYRVDDIPEPEPQEGQVIVKVKTSGICGTDVHILRGEFPISFPVIPGHEFTGVISKVGRGVKALKEGKLVAIEPNLWCGRCEFCRRGLTNYCADFGAFGFTTQGAYAEYVAVPAKNIYLLPDDADLETFSLAEPLSCVLHGQSKLSSILGKKVVVLGAGPIGVLHALIGRMRGASRVLLYSRGVYRLELAQRLFGLEYIESFDGIIDSLGGKADIVIESTGSTTMALRALDIVKNCGEVLYFGAPPSEQTIPLIPFYIYRNEIKVIGSFSLVSKDFLSALSLLQEQNEFKKTITHRFRLDEFGKFLEIEKTRKFLKAIFIFD
ncbi:alcohol dehydrogenase catalytic domain-containing protein [Candidatus Sumerlaeota bacterium]|nr:alcohol dehydrogenase catalytic domain-containing protein [Candidatus Sumerlaeota bacterium]